MSGQISNLSSATTFAWSSSITTLPVVTITSNNVVSTANVDVGAPVVQVASGIQGGTRYIDIDLGTDTNIMASLTISASGTGATDTTPILMATDGMPGNTVGVQSSYTVTDYAGTEVTTFTSFVPDTSTSDLATVLTSISSAVNINIESPIDFMAAANGNVVTLTAQSVGLITGFWSFTANHNNQVTDAGDISFGNAVVTQAGLDALTNVQYASGTFTVGNYVQAIPLSTSTFSAARTVSWTTVEPVVSTLVTDYDFRTFIGPRNANGFVYMASTVPPAAPTGGSINFTTGVFTPPTGWSNDAPTTTTVGQQIYVTHWTLTEATFDGVQSVIYQTPVLTQIVVNDVKSINYDGTTTPGANDRYIDTGATQGYFLDGSTGQLIATDVIARDFDVSSRNVRLGPDAGNPNNITGTDNVTIGANSGNALTTANNSVFVGDDSGMMTTTGGNNIGVGNLAAASVTTASNNLFFGNNAGMMAMDANGDPSTRLAWTGTGRNIGIGSVALGSTIRPDLLPITSEDNIGIGQFTLVGLTSGNSNLAMGFFTGGAVTTGMDNIFLGARAGGSTTTGSSNILIGDSVEASSATASSEIKIGQGTETAVNIGSYDLSNIASPTAWTDLTDTANALGSAGQLVSVNPTGTALEFITSAQSADGAIDWRQDVTRINLGAGPNTSNTLLTGNTLTNRIFLVRRLFITTTDATSVTLAGGVGTKINLTHTTDTTRGSGDNAQSFSFRQDGELLGSIYVPASADLVLTVPAAFASVVTIAGDVFELS